jgi:hypothetical protein
MDQQEDRAGAGLGVADGATVERHRLDLHLVVDVRTVASQRLVHEGIARAVEALSPLHRPIGGKSEAGGAVPDFAHMMSLPFLGHKEALRLRRAAEALLVAAIQSEGDAG